MLSSIVVSLPSFISFSILVFEFQIWIIVYKVLYIEIPSVCSGYIQVRMYTQYCVVKNSVDGKETLLSSRNNSVLPTRAPVYSLLPIVIMPRDLLHPSLSEEKSKHKLKRLIQAPNSFFMDVKCPGCFHITTVFSHAQVSLTS